MSSKGRDSDSHWINCIVVGLLLLLGHWTDAQGGVASLGISWAPPCARNAGVRIRLLPVRICKIRRFSHIFGNGFCTQTTSGADASSICTAR